MNKFHCDACNPYSRTVCFEFIEHGDVVKLLALQGLDAQGIETSIRNRFGPLIESGRTALKAVA